MITHPISPVFDKDSRVLILGSFPSVKSREIDGSSDSSIRNVTVNDITVILESADITAIYLNGRKAYQLYQKYLFPMIRRDGICLPSTSPANASWSLERLTETWKTIKF